MPAVAESEGISLSTVSKAVTCASSSVSDDELEWNPTLARPERLKDLRTRREDPELVTVAKDVAVLASVEPLAVERLEEKPRLENLPQLVEAEVEEKVLWCLPIDLSEPATVDGRLGPGTNDDDASTDCTSSEAAASGTVLVRLTSEVFVD